MIHPVASKRQSSPGPRAAWIDAARSTNNWLTGGIAARLHWVFGPRRHSGFGILMYHRVYPRLEGSAPPTWNVTPEQLHTQLAGLLERGFEPWSLKRLLAAERERTPIPPGAFAVTFDDGYENNYSQAWPILRNLGVPATIFLATAFLGSDEPFPFDDWSAAGSPSVPGDAWRPLSIGQCQEMLSGDLIDLGAHTHRHERFLGRRDHFREDLGECLAVMAGQFGITQPTFAFPFGVHSAELVEVARQEGLACALTTEAAPVRRGASPFAWGRFHVEARDTPSRLAAKLGGWYTAAATARNTLARPLFAAVRGARSAPQACTSFSAGPDFNQANPRLS